MAYEFTKLSDVALADTLNDSANVLVEENGEIKKTPKSAIGAQADWNETNETSAAYILNKPESLGGYKYYYYYNYYLYKASNATEKPDTVGYSDRAISQAAFESDYYNCPVMINNDNGVISLCTWYGYYAGDWYIPVNGNASMSYPFAQNIYWGTATE